MMKIAINHLDKTYRGRVHALNSLMDWRYYVKFGRHLPPQC